MRTRRRRSGCGSGTGGERPVPGDATTLKPTGGPCPALRGMGSQASGQLVGSTSSCRQICHVSHVLLQGRPRANREGQEPATPAIVHGAEERSHLATPH